MSAFDTLITGSDEVLDAAMNVPDALIVDRGSEEPEVLAEVARLLPGFSFTHSFDSEGACHVQMTYSGRSAMHAYIDTPYNCFRVVLDVESLIQPEASIRVYAPTMASMTHAFTVRGVLRCGGNQGSTSPHRLALATIASMSAGPKDTERLRALSIPHLHSSPDL